jgi:phosphatidylserine/phosphatidylglycerophosphate/cardiolipin synthase-like enzyme
VFLPILAGLTGCQKTEFSTPILASNQELVFSGSVMGGQNPVTGSLIQLYAVGTTGDGSPSTHLISATLTSSDGSGLSNSNANPGNANNTLPAGSFTITGDYTCPSATAEVYLVGTGGNPGLTNGTNNTALALMAALGPCGDLSSSTYVVMNELTTVGAVAALANFMTSYPNVGSGSGDASQLQTAFLTANLYTNTTSGSVPGATLPAFFSASSTALQTLGDLVAACVNSSGGIAGNSNPCGQLFALATPSGGSAPTDTVGALLNILKQPTVNASQLYALLPSTPAFAPTLSSAPASWALPIAADGSTGLTYTLYAFPESDNSVTPLYALVNSAQKTIDMTMYELEDTVFSGDLVSACSRGVKVRVVLSSSEESANATAYAQLNAAGSNCSAVYSNTAFTNTHQKTFTIDGTTTAIMSLNLQSKYYSTTRDFALIENDPVDIAAIEATFNADYAAGTPSGGSQGASDFNYQPGAGDDLIWSPTTAQTDMLAIINGATKTLLVENEEMDASNIVSALEAACVRGVTVHIAMVNDDNEYESEFTALQAAGCKVNVYPDTETGFYVHAKAVVADYGLPTQSVYMGSINYSTASMTKNRELGVYIADPASVQLLNATMASDYAGGSPY